MFSFKIPENNHYFPRQQYYVNILNAVNETASTQLDTLSTLLCRIVKMAQSTNLPCTWGPQPASALSSQEISK